MFSNADQSQRGKYQIYYHHDGSTAGKTTTLGKVTFANRHFSNFQLIHQNFCGELFIFSHSQKFIVGKLFSIKSL